jgi:signal transduction histidine kinase
VAELTREVDFPYLQANLPRLLGKTREGIERVTRIVHSLRGLARTDAPRRRQINLADLVQSNLEILRGRFKQARITVEQDHDADPRLACADTQISQLLLNLLVNAHQAIEATGRPDGRIRIATHRLAEEMLLEIKDNGCGIAPEDLPRLFDPFFTTKEVGEGTGLGLSISHHIVTAHGGRIEAESRPGQGACFRVYLPLKPTPENHDRPQTYPARGR